MDTSSGSPTLAGLLMSTLNCGNFSSSTGCLHLLQFFFVPVESKQVMPCFELEEVAIVCQTNRFVLLFYSLLLSLICSNLLIGRFWTVVMAWRDGRLGRWHPKLDSFTTTTSKSNYSFTTLPIMWFHCLIDARFSSFFMQNSIRFFLKKCKNNTPLFVQTVWLRVWEQW